MSYTYPQAMDALQAIANDYIKVLRPQENACVYLVCDPHAQTASVTWDIYAIRVNMPVRPAASVMTQIEFENWVAYLLHELGHPTHTSLSAWQNAVRLGVSRMVNGLEDVRMEQAVIASGIVPNAKAVLSRLIARKVTEARVTNWKPNARAEFSWTICVLGRAANGYAIDPDDLAWVKSQIKPGSTVATVLAWAMPALAACKSTADCVTLAQRIAQALAAPQGAPVDINPGNGEGEGAEGDGEGEASEGAGAGEGAEGAGEGAEGDGEGEGAEGDGEGSEGTGEASEGAGDKGKGEGSEGETNAGKGGQGHGDGSTDTDEMPVSDNDLVQRELAPEGEAMPKGTGAATERDVINILRDSVIQSQPRSADATRRMTVNGARMRDAAAQASRQRALLARALRANETDDREGGRKAGRLDRGALSRAMAGAPNVFARRELSEGYDTDVCILLDASGSMAGPNMISALETGLVIAQAAGSVGASCTTEIFNSSGYVRAGSLASKRVPNPADFGALQNSANGGTPLSAHMARAAVSQAKRAPQKRRVLFVVTDGGCDYGPNTVKRMATYLEQACGTTLAHVSIGTPLQGSFRAEVCVPHGVPLAKVGLDHFVKVLQAL